MLKEIPANLYASTPQDEVKQIVISQTYFEELLPFLDLARNRKAYVMVPEEDRYSLNNIVEYKEQNTTRPSNLMVKLGSKSSWNTKGEYYSQYFNLLKLKNGHKRAELIEQARRKIHPDAGSDGLEEELTEAQIGWKPIHNYADAIRYFKDKFGVDYLSQTDGGKLLLADVNVFNDNKPRPFAYKVSAVFEKGSEAYILVLDTILDIYLNKGFTTSPHKSIPRSNIDIKSYENILVPKRLIQRYDILNSKGAFNRLLESLEDAEQEINEIWGSVLRDDKGFKILEDSTVLTNKSIVYSENESPEFLSELNTLPKKFKFTVGYYGSIPVIATYSDESDIYRLLQQAECDPQVYRIFSHNYYDKKATSKYITKDTIQLYVKDFYHFNDGKSFPIKTIKRKVEWEPTVPPEIPPELLNSKGNPVEKAIQYYLKTGIGLSYWNFRGINAK